MHRLRYRPNRAQRTMGARVERRRVILIGFAIAAGHSAPARAQPPPQEEPAPGYSLDDEWNQWWRRIADRSARPDPDGPVQQRFAERLYPEYELDLAVAGFPLRLERRWAEQTTGARLWVQSLDEFELANRVQLKTRADLGGHWHIGIGFDRTQTRTIRSDLVRLDFGYAPRGDTGPWASLSFYPRWEKIDSDAAAAVGYRHAEWGEASLRLFALDPFTNASFALTEAREAVPPVSARQLDFPLAVAGELATRQFVGVRSELYLGGILPHTTRYRFAEGSRNYRQRLSGILAGALVEWQPHATPMLRVGGTALSVATRWDRGHLSRPDLDRTVSESSHQVSVYALASPLDPLELEARVRFTSRPETDSGPGAPESGSDARDDSEWLASVRGEWMFSRAFGAELGFMRGDRTTSGQPDVRVDGTRHRLVTRALLRLGRMWASFGVSWDLDPGGKGAFGGGGATLIVDL